MKKLLLFAFALSCSATLDAQSVSHQWTKAFVSTGNNESKQIKIAKDADGRTISVTHFTKQVDADPSVAGTSSVATPGNVNVYNSLITALNEQGNYMYHLHFSSSSENKIVDIATANNNVYVLGYQSDNSPMTIGTSTLTPTNTSGGSYYLASLASNGTAFTVNWAYSFNKSMSNTYFNSIVAGDVSGSTVLFVGGASGTSINLNIKGGTTQNFVAANSTHNPMFVCYSENCDYVNHNYMITTNTAQIISMELKNSNLYMTGNFYGTLQIPPISVNIASKGVTDVFVAKYTAGTMQPSWAKRLGSPLYDYGNAIGVDDNENVYITGEFEGSNFNLDPAASGSSIVNNLSDIFLTKLNASGIFEWGRHINGYQDEYVSDIAVAGNGDCFITGRTRTPLLHSNQNGSQGGIGSLSANPSGTAFDIYLIRYNTSGVATFSGCIGTATGIGYEVGTSLLLNSGYLYFGANTTRFSTYNDVDFNFAPIEFAGLNDYYANFTLSAATLSKYYACENNPIAAFTQSMVSTCPNVYQFATTSYNPDYDYQWSSTALGLNADSSVLNIPNPSAAYANKAVVLQVLDSIGCFTRVSDIIYGSNMSAVSTTITATASTICSGNTMTFTAPGDSVHWYSNVMDTVPIAAGSNYSFVAPLQDIAPAYVFAATVDPLTGCENPRAMLSYTVDYVVPPTINMASSGPFVGCADGQPRVISFTSPQSQGSLWADSTSTVDLYGVPGFIYATNYFDISSHYSMTTPDTITVWCSYKAGSCESIRYPIQFILNDCSIGINENTDLSTMLKVYPNPVKNILSIESRVSSKISVVNLLGTVVSSADVNFGTNKLDVSNLSSGVYFIQTPNGAFSKFVKE